MMINRIPLSAAVSSINYAKFYIVQCDHTDLGVNLVGHQTAADPGASPSLGGVSFQLGVPDTARFLSFNEKETQVFPV